MGTHHPRAKYCMLLGEAMTQVISIYIITGMRFSIACVGCDTLLLLNWLDGISSNIWCNSNFKQLNNTFEWCNLNLSQWVTAMRRRSKPALQQERLQWKVTERLKLEGCLIKLSLCHQRKQKMCTAGYKNPTSLGLHIILWGIYWRCTGYRIYKGKWLTKQQKKEKNLWDLAWTKRKMCNYRKFNK